MNTGYTSNFLKADFRIQQSVNGCHSYQSANNNRISVTDMFLTAGASTVITLPQGVLNIIFPIVGAISFDSLASGIQPEELLCYSGNTSRELTVANPDTGENVNFLHIIIYGSGYQVSDKGYEVERLNIHAKNCLLQGEGLAACLKAGVYDSRVKDATTLSGSCSRLFSFIINGSFDFEERLMEYRDSLYQWDVQQVDFEALSEAAIILLIECSH